MTTLWYDRFHDIMKGMLGVGVIDIVDDTSFFKRHPHKEGKHQGWQIKRTTPWGLQLTVVLDPLVETVKMDGWYDGDLFDIVIDKTISETYCYNKRIVQEAEISPFLKKIMIWMV